jgi:SAM-dependent methyltransferase
MSSSLIEEVSTTIEADPSADQYLFALRVNSWPPMRLVPASSARAWMDATPYRFATRCMPLLIANQWGWFVLNSHRLTVTWDGSEVQFECEESGGRCPASHHFGSGIVTFNLPWLFRTPPGWNLLCRGPANWPKDGVCALEGVVETDWSVATFTVNWQITRKGMPIIFEKDEPIAMVVPCRRNSLERFAPIEKSIETDPKACEGYRAWSASRSQFLADLKKTGSDAVKQGWQKHYTLGKHPDGTRAADHQTKLALKPFVASIHNTRVTYNQTVFDVADLEQARRIILTPDGSSTEERWANETPYIVELIGEALAPNEKSVLLDYGCGIGRLAKAMIERYGCTVVGVDISPTMRELSQSYVGSDRFHACSPMEFRSMIDRESTFDGAIAVWVLQHCSRPAEDISLLRRALKPSARVLVVNHNGRRMPTVEYGWADDGTDVKALLQAAFEMEREFSLPPDRVNSAVSRFSFGGIFVSSPK